MCSVATHDKRITRTTHKKADASLVLSPKQNHHHKVIQWPQTMLPFSGSKNFDMGFRWDSNLNLLPGNGTSLMVAHLSLQSLGCGGNR